MLAPWSPDSTFELVGTPVPVFRVGPPARPPITHDDGHLGKFPARLPSAEDRAELRMWIARLEAGEAIQGVPFLPHNDIPDALAAYRHFLFGEGQARTFSYERYVLNDPSGTITLANGILQAQLGAETLHAQRKARPDGHSFRMSSSAIPCGTDPEDSLWGELYLYPETENWQKTIGAHYIWISASVSVSQRSSGPFFTMGLVLHAEDKYNFNPGQHDIATKIPDQANGRFELAGLGRQYFNYSTLSRVVRWSSLVSGGSVPIAVSGRPGRQRRPGDNRRLRNRL